jgi:signal peptidase II
LLDQVSKYWAYNKLRFNPDIGVIDGFFKLSYVENTGIAFGVLSSFSGNWKIWLLSSISVIAISLVTYFALKAPGNKKLFLIALMLVLGGIIGNLIDRIHLHAVIDFIELYVGDYHWPTFNVADMAICIGAFFLSIDILSEVKEVVPQEVAPQSEQLKE